MLRHGIFTSEAETPLTPITKSGTLPVFIGTAPVWTTTHTDNVTVMGPIPEMFNIGLTYYISRTDLTKEQAIINRVNNTINNYITWQCEKIDRDINPSKLVSDIISAGAKRVELESPVFKTLNGWYLATLSNTNIVYGGIEHD